MADQTVQFSDSDTFDLLLEGVLQGSPAAVEIATSIPFDATSPPAFPARLNGWIDLWVRANPKTGLDVGMACGTLSLRDLLDLRDLLEILGRLILEAAERLWPVLLRWRRSRRRMGLLRGYRLEVLPIDGKAVLLLAR